MSIAADFEKVIRELFCALLVFQSDSHCSAPSSSGTPLPRRMQPTRRSLRCVFPAFQYFPRVPLLPKETKCDNMRRYKLFKQVQRRERARCPIHRHRLPLAVYRSLLRRPPSATSKALSHGPFRWRRAPSGTRGTASRCGMAVTMIAFYYRTHAASKSTA